MYPYMRNCELTRPAAGKGVRLIVSRGKKKTKGGLVRRTHDHSRAQTSEKPPETSLLTEDDKSRDHGPLGTVALVDLTEQRVGGVREDGGGETGDDTRSQVETESLGGREILLLILCHRLVGELVHVLVRRYERAEVRR